MSPWSLTQEANSPGSTATTQTQTHSYPTHFSTPISPPPTRQSPALHQPAQLEPEIFPYPLPATPTTSATPLSPTPTLPLRKGTSLRTH